MSDRKQGKMECDVNDTRDGIAPAQMATLPERLKGLSDALQQCVADPCSPQAQDMLLTELRGLRDIGGFSLRAAELEIFLRRFIEDGGDFARIAASIRDLLRYNVPRNSIERQMPVMVEAFSDRLIYLVHDNTIVARDLMEQLKYFGYEVVVISELALLQKFIDRRIPAAVIMDLGSPAGILAGMAELARLRKVNQPRFATIFISTRGDFGTRLAAIQAGADSYFCKPIDMMALVDRLDALIAYDEVQPYRVLIIEGNAESAECHAATLHDAGMEVRVLYKLTDLLHTLNVYRPELILMNVHMPGCEGIDLAKLIRSETTYVDLPIVFLSDDGDIEAQLNAIESGADDFLMKSIAPAHLVSALSGRAKRYRDLRSLILRDSLTGLLNHSAVKEQLTREVFRSRRDSAPMALAMIDIDHFKRINDTYGHQVGDQVIRALARQLQQRLRRSDVIGRYGGEEFAVILPRTTAVIAVDVLDQIREAFAAIRHYTGQKDFTATFSAGIAEISPDMDAETLFRNADAVLYRAKNGGRNCVVRS